MLTSTRFLNFNNKLYGFKKTKKINNSSIISNPKSKKNNDKVIAMYYGYFPIINFTGKYPDINREKLESLDIPNLQFIDNNSVRGESLAHKRNIRYIPAIKNSGIRQIIDLKTSDFSTKFKNIVEANGMSYMHFPIDSEKTSTRDIIDKLPEFFKRINDGYFYIACAQGLHRTDIALSINYLFNKDVNSEQPPILYGHRRKKGLICEDIFKRCNNIFDSLTDEDRAILGLTNYSKEEYIKRKKILMQFNKI